MATTAAADDDTDDRNCYAVQMWLTRGLGTPAFVKAVLHKEGKWEGIMQRYRFLARHQWGPASVRDSPLDYCGIVPASMWRAAFVEWASEHSHWTSIANDCEFIDMLKLVFSQHTTAEPLFEEHAGEIWACLPSPVAISRIFMIEDRADFDAAAAIGESDVESETPFERGGGGENSLDDFVAEESDAGRDRVQEAWDLLAVEEEAELVRELETNADQAPLADDDDGAGFLRSAVAEEQRFGPEDDEDDDVSESASL